MEKLRRTSPTYEEQANKQGFTFGEDAALIQILAEGLCLLHIHGILSDEEFSKAQEKFTNLLLDAIKLLH